MADDDRLAEIQSLIEAGPAGGAAQEVKQRYIGVSDGYAFNRTDVGTAGSASHFAAREHGDNTRLYTGNAQPLAMAPRYVVGSEYRMRSLSPERIAALQQELAGAGLIGKKQIFRVGVWDETSADAYRKVLAYANQGGIDEETALSELKYNATTGVGGLMRGDGTSADDETVRAGRIQRITPAVTLEEQVQQSARQRLGRKLRPSEVSKFVSIYNGIEKHANAQELAADQTTDQGTNVTLTAPPTADVGAEQYLDHGFAQEEAGVHTLGFLGVIDRMVGEQ